VAGSLTDVAEWRSHYRGRNFYDWLHAGLCVQKSWPLVLREDQIFDYLLRRSCLHLERRVGDVFVSQRSWGWSHQLLQPAAVWLTSSTRFSAQHRSRWSRQLAAPLSAFVSPRLIPSRCVAQLFMPCTGFLCGHISRTCSIALDDTACFIFRIVKPPFASKTTTHPAW
jgi:hypothetical protein